MSGAALRFLWAGAIVASLPLVASRFGDRAAGWLLMLPVVTAAGFITLAVTRGAPAVAAASWSALTALPVLAVFLLTVHVVSGWGRS